MFRCLSFALVLAAAPAAADPVITDKVTLYAVSGVTKDELRAAMRDQGLRDMNGRPGDALTTWHLDWRYRTMPGRAGCSVGDVRVTIDVGIEAPELDAEADLPHDVRSIFEAYARHLMEHEQGHRRIAIEGARRLEDALKATPHAASCKTVEATAEARARAELYALAARSAAYDKATRHGRTQGARFP
jgi:predicted secreted Zn-dependent protease